MALCAARRVKILFPYLARARTANWSRYQQLLLARARAGDSVHLLEPPPRLSDETNFREIPYVFPPGFELEEVPIGKGFWTRRFPLDKIVKKGAYSLVANRRARQLMSKNRGADRPDVLLIYNLTQRSLLGSPVQVVFDVADELPEMLRHEAGPLGPILAPVARRVLAGMLARASVVTTPSRRMLPRLGPRAVLVPNGVDPAEIREARAAAARLDSARSGAREFRIGFLGSFEYFVDFDLVLELAARLPEVRFVLIGGGRRWSEVQAGIERRSLRNVSLTGPLAHASALARLAECDVSLCPFTRDPVGHGASPLKLFESLALGVPVLATRTEEILLEGPPNTLFADDAGEALAAVRELRSREASRIREESESASRRILESHSWDRIAENWVSLVLSRSREDFL
jgi:glycosyltransferase involved in cell wall biosynthesis